MGGDRTHERLLVEVEADAVLDAAVHELIVRHAVAEHVDEPDLPAQPGIEQRLRDRGQLAALVAQASSFVRR